MGKFSYKCLCPYVVENISKKSLYILHNQSGVELSKKYNVDLLKPYLDPVNPQMTRINMFHLMRDHQIYKMLTLVKQIIKIWKVYFKRIAIHRRIVP